MDFKGLKVIEDFIFTILDKISSAVYYVIPLVLLVLSFLSNGEFFSELGSIAEVLLIITLFMKPLAMITRIKFLMRSLKYRRQLGVSTFWFFFFHAAGLIFTLNLTVSSFFTNTFLFWGGIAGIMMTLLAVTSNNYSVRLLKRNWKRLHYLAYPLLFAVLIHSGLSDDGLGKAVVIGGIFILLKLLEWKKVNLSKYWKK